MCSESHFVEMEEPAAKCRKILDRNVGLSVTAAKWHGRRVSITPYQQLYTARMVMNKLGNGQGSRHKLLTREGWGGGGAV